ncbi:hypothetical protein G6F57_009856 [Rhizopus arrhizus]|uniref:Mitochondrial intermembrane space import and assembly protein 40 n=1 Tax=Rhizopus oryzae TaxID=64495 RepID=A0A9P6X2E5_RHIOR|nr:hypothetical protein G6F23_005634 [Rhizopus arrhizus]KAG1414536.1 hypothetical protein G6F58_006910 [Rhizopus delemar]KAG0758479.1 hypothetical protein G6F24_009770 [Rhizopus arrhizus]KAG0796579.1 hypothetical protein G6F21_001204 [Rhizopus arrhizus]KAG0798582.1 hypothetical protein G6F22_004080 [Rhizopus arrhizus]
MSTAVEEKDIVKFVTEEEINRASTEETTKQEEPKEQSAAFNPETGEINWDCPCLGGMAQGPCGEDFKAAFSCFVFSEAEPKGIDCVDKFKAMQDCFRRHPDVYADEIDDDEDDEEVIVNEATEEANVVAPCPDEEETTFSSWISSWF